MRPVIPLTLPTLDEAFEFIAKLNERIELEPVMTDRQWEQAVTAAIGRRDREGLASLLHVDLVPAIGRALGALGATVRCARDAPDDHPEMLGLELSHRIEQTQLAVMRAGKAVWAAEHREGLLPDRSGPSSPRSDSSQQVLGKMASYLDQELCGHEVRKIVAGDLGYALRKLTAPARAAVECMEAAQIDDLLPYPLQQELFAVFHALSSVRLYLLATHMAESTVERARVSSLR